MASRRSSTRASPCGSSIRSAIPTERTFEVHIGPLQSDAASHADIQAGVVLFFRDLTSARRLEAMRADFVANASHELRTPLASLLGFIETLQGPARDDAAARERFLDIMRGQAQRMTRLIDDLLSLSRIEMRAHLSPHATVDLRADRGPDGRHVVAPGAGARRRDRRPGCRTSPCSCSATATSFCALSRT